MAGPSDRGKIFEKAAEEIEAEVKRVIGLIEEKVVPRAQRDGEKILRRLSEELARWADQLREAGSGGGPPRKNQ